MFLHGRTCPVRRSNSARNDAGMNWIPRGAAVGVFAPAKINLYLHVVGRRADGYHRLDSLVAFADIGDWVTAAPAESLSVPFGAALYLDKRLPAASGIGGGSSDAAATLRALDHLWHRPIDPAALAALALKLGADTPACLAARPVWVGGIGERIEEAAALPPAGIVLANPRLR